MTALTRTQLEALARDRLEDLEVSGPVLGPAPYHARFVGFGSDRRPCFMVANDDGFVALDAVVDPISAQLAAWAATRRAGVTPIACLCAL